METILDIEESQFQLFYSLYALPNIFTLPFVGYFVDKLGIRLSILVMSIGLAVCQLLIAIGAFAKSY
jgi:MFS family permease